jgi:hypothetical protein
MNSINPHAMRYPKVSNTLDFLKYKNQDISVNDKNQNHATCDEPDCFGHPEEYTCDTCSSSMGLVEDPTSHIAFDVVHESMKTYSDYAV